MDHDAVLDRVLLCIRFAANDPARDPALARIAKRLSPDADFLGSLTPSPFGDGAPPRYDALIDAPVTEDLSSLADLFDTGTIMHRFHVRRRLGKGASLLLPRAGATVISAIVKRPHLSNAETDRRWLEHIVLAAEIHHGASLYLQNLVLRASAGAPAYFGFAYLQVPSAECIGEALFRTPADMTVINEDVAEFVERADSWVARAVDGASRLSHA